MSETIRIPTENNKNYHIIAVLYAIIAFDIKFKIGLNIEYDNKITVAECAEKSTKYAALANSADSTVESADFAAHSAHSLSAAAFAECAHFAKYSAHSAKAATLKGDLFEFVYYAEYTRAACNVESAVLTESADSTVESAIQAVKELLIAYYLLISLENDYN